MIRPINEDQITVLMMLLLQPWWLQSPILSWREFQIVLIAKSLQLAAAASPPSHQLGRKWRFPLKKYFFCSLCTSKVIPKEMSESRLMKYTLSQPKIFWLFNQYFETQRKIVRYWGTSKQQPTSTFTDCNLWNFASGRGLSSSTNPKEKTNGTKVLLSLSLSRLSYFFLLWATSTGARLGQKCIQKNS